MPRDEVRTGKAIAVDEHAIAAATRRDRAVADLAGAKAVMLLPDMRDRNAEIVLPAGHHSGRGRTGAVIGDQHLEIPVGLPRQRAQREVERVLAIAGRDDDADQISHGGAPIATPSCNGSTFPPRSPPPAGSPRGRRETHAAECRCGRTTTGRA